MPKFGVNLPWPDVGTSSALMTARIRADYLPPEYQTPLTIKAVASGMSRYETPLGRYVVTPDVFLILNDGQRYTMEARPEWQTTTLCPFFAHGFVESAVAAMRSSDARLLDAPEDAPPQADFVERLYPMTGPVAKALQSITKDNVEDAFHDLAAAMATLRDDVRRDIERFPAVRLATREELYRRLHRARDFIVSCYAEAITVDDVARVATLSRFHLHRAFKRAFGVTPMQMLQQRRLEVARAMLARGMHVTETCYAVGFESLGSFSALFSRRFGHAPSKKHS